MYYETCRIIASVFVCSAGLSAVAFDGGGASDSTGEVLESAYAEMAFPAANRAIDRARFADALNAARSRAEWIDRCVEKAFASRLEDDLAKVRVCKRRFLRTRALAFAERYLGRDDATGFGFAERALSDAAALDALLDDEIVWSAKSPDASCSPVILNVRDFGARGDGQSDDATAFVRAAAAVRKLGGRSSVLRIPAGTYRMGHVQNSGPITDELGEYCCNTWVLEAQCLFANLENCSIEGEGPERTLIRGSVHDATQVALVNCRNVRLSGLDVALEQAPFIEGIVDAFDPESGACELSLKPGSLTPDHPGWKEPGESFGYLFDGEGRMLQEGRLLPWNKRGDPVRLGDRRWRIVFDRNENPGGYDRFVRNIRPGLTVVLPNRRNTCAGLSVRFCSFCTIENVWIRNSRSSAFDTIRSRATTFYRCRDKPNEGCFLSSNADGCYCDPGSFVYRCVFDSMGDDGLNSRSYGVVAQRGLSPTEVVASDRGLGLRGDLMVFVHPHTAQCLGNAPLVQTDALVKGSNGWVRVSRFKFPVPECWMGSYMSNPARAGVGTIVSGCTFRNGRLAGNVVQTPTALFEDNTYENLNEGLRLGALGDYKEGPSPYNVLVRNCRFERTTVGLTAWLRMCDSSKSKWFDVKCAPIRGIDADNNVFRQIGSVAVDFRNAGDCSFENSRFEEVKTEWSFSRCEDIRR